MAFHCDLGLPSDAGHRHVHLLAICISSSEKYLFKSFTHFKVRFFFLNVLNINSYLLYELTYFPYFVGFLFTLLIRPFDIQKL